MDSHGELREARKWALQLQSADTTLRHAFVEWVMASTDRLEAFLTILFLDAELQDKAPPLSQKPAGRGMQ
jgi:ferric-dicitrate binding protein FerR (iron transport regulator)